MPAIAWVLIGLVLLMLAKASKVAIGYLRGVAFNLELAGIGNGYSLRPDAASAWLAMASAASADGVTFDINSAFRTHEQQVALQTTRAGYAAPVDYSPHQRGIAVDVETAGGSNAAFAWLNTNASMYGFARTVASEPWHWEYTL